MLTPTTRCYRSDNAGPDLRSVRDIAISSFAVGFPYTQAAVVGWDAKPVAVCYRPRMSAPKQPKETLTNTLADGELSDDDLEQVTGGTKVAPPETKDVTANKKTAAEVAAAKADAYIRG